METKLNIRNNNIKNIINDLNQEKNVVCLYNPKTCLCDLIGIVDLNNVRYVDFDDNHFTLTNKGIDFQISDFIN